jgi:2-keto-4-pentenoate hydratase
MEIAGSCVAGIASLGVLAIVSDFGLNEAFVFGRPIDRWREKDLSTTRIQIRLGDETVGRGRGSEVPGGPVGAVVWLANHLSARQVGLKPGDWISTGACGGMYTAAVDGRATADFDELGTVHVSFGRRAY